MFATDWRMSLIAVVAFPLAVVPIIRIGRRLRRISSNTQATIGELTGFLDDVFKGARQVKAYGMEDHERRRADALFESVFGYFFKASKTRSRTYPIMETLTGLALAAVLFWGGQQVLNGETTVGKFMTFFAALVMAYQPLRSLDRKSTRLHSSHSCASRMPSFA